MQRSALSVVNRGSGSLGSTYVGWKLSWLFWKIQLRLMLKGVKHPSRHSLSPLSSLSLLQMPGLDLLPKITVCSTLCQLVGSCQQTTSGASLGIEHNNDSPFASSLALAAPSTEHGRARQPRPSPQSLLPPFPPVPPMPKTGR